VYKYQLNNNFLALKDFLLNIQEHFEHNTKTIHKARNEIKIIEFETQKYVVKSFKVPSTLKAMYYTQFDSKAKRSYEYSLKLGDLVPEPVGYIEYYNANKLQESFYISRYFAYDWTMKEVLRDEVFTNREELLKAFARFSAALHNQGVLHLDYSAGNILIKKDSDDTYTFKIVDLNRMKFKENLSPSKRMKNFDMLWAKKEHLIIIAKEYARISNLDAHEATKKILYYAFKLKLIKNFKKLLKGRVKNIDW